MPKANTLSLDTGDMFPHLEFDIFQGDKIVLPEYLKGSWGVVLFYRGDW